MAAIAHMGCYNSYFISKDELEKLESGVEVKEVVTVQADCRTGGSMAEGESLDGRKLAEAAPEAEGKSTESGKTASDATSTKAGPKGCTEVPVSTANAIKVVTKEGEQRRVTPFNFMMSQRQLVSPEYDLLVRLDRVEGAKVREFSTWKTVGMIVGVSAATIGTFVGLSLTTPDPVY